MRIQFVGLIIGVALYAIMIAPFYLPGRAAARWARRTPVDAAAVFLLMVGGAAIVLAATTTIAADWLPNIGTESFFAAFTIAVIDRAVRRREAVETQPLSARRLAPMQEALRSLVKAASPNVPRQKWVAHDALVVSTLRGEHDLMMTDSGAMMSWPGEVMFDDDYWPTTVAVTDEVRRALDELESAATAVLGHRHFQFLTPRQVLAVEDFLQAKSRLEYDADGALDHEDCMRLERTVASLYTAFWGLRYRSR